MIRLPCLFAGPGATDVEEQIKWKDEDGKGEDRGEVLGGIYKEELGLTVDCIKRNPKSYPAWHHRKWAIENGLDFLGGRYELLPRVVCKHAGNQGREGAGYEEGEGRQFSLCFPSALYALVRRLEGITHEPFAAQPLALLPVLLWLWCTQLNHPFGE